MAKKFSWLGFRERFGAKLDELIQERGPGFGQIQFAELVTARSGEVMTQPRVSTLLNGRADPSLEEVEMLALGLGVSPGWLAFDGREAPVAKPPPSEPEKSHR
jgi:transcriptional regulator with XRE-family HTH domain